MKLDIKKRLYFIGLSFLLLGSCGKEPSSTISINLSLPAPAPSSTNNNTSATTTRAAKVYTSSAPIHVYLQIADANTGTIYFGPQLIDLGNDAAGTYPSADNPVKCTGSSTTTCTYPITIPQFTVNSSTSTLPTLAITGYYVAEGLQAGGNVCNDSGNNSGSGSGSASGSGSTIITNNDNNDNVFFADLNTNPITINLNNDCDVNADGSKTCNAAPILKAITFDKFGFTVFKADGTTRDIPNYDESSYVGTGSGSGSANNTLGVVYTTFTPKSGETNPIITFVSLYDPISKTTIKDPCTGRTFGGRIDAFGNITTNLPIKFSDSVHLEPQVTKFLIDAGTYTPELLAAKATTPLSVNRYDIIAATAKNTTSMNCTNTTYPNGTPPITAAANTDGIPMFWKFILGSSTTTPMNPNTDSFLESTQIIDTGTTICNRIAHNFNPRFPDVSNVNQYYLQPVNPLASYPYQPYTTQTISYNLNTPYPSDLQLINPISLFIYNNYYYRNSTNTNSNDNSIITKPLLNVKCSIFHFDQTSSTYVSVPGQAWTATTTNPFTDTASTYGYIDCTNFGINYGTTYGTAQFFAPAGIITPSPQYPLYIAFYYGDSDGYLLYNANYQPNSGSNVAQIQPSNAHPLVLQFFNGPPG